MRYGEVGGRVDRAHLANSNVGMLSNLVREFGFTLYDGRRAQGELREAILSIKDR